jgi:hypothetical protein
MMNMKKKTTVLCLFALTIGLSITLPITYFANTEKNGTIQATPCFDVDILYANAFPNPYDKDIINVNVVANFTIPPELADLKGADAKIEVYKFHVYSDQGSIANLTYTFELAKDIPDPNAPNGVNQAIRSWGTDHWVFADGTIYDFTDVIGPTDGRTSNGFGNTEGIPNIHDKYLTGYVAGAVSAENDERSAQAVINLGNAQVIYFDVTRALIVTYKLQANPTSSVASVITTLGNNEILGHIKLTKTDFGFASGDVPDFLYDGMGFLQVLPPPWPSSVFDIVQPKAHVDTTDSFARKTTTCQ